MGVWAWVVDVAEYLWFEDGLIDFVDNPHKLSAINPLHEGITHVSGCT